MEKKITVENLHKEICPECGGALFKVDGERTVLIMCLNHRRASVYKIKGTGECNYQFVLDKSVFYNRK